MSNPWEFRETMKAAFGFGDKTVDQVIAEQKARAAAEKNGRKRGSTTPPPSTSSAPRQSEIDKLNEILAKAKPRHLPMGE